MSFAQTGKTNPVSMFEMEDSTKILPPSWSGILYLWTPHERELIQVPWLQLGSFHIRTSRRSWELPFLLSISSSLQSAAMSWEGAGGDEGSTVITSMYLLMVAKSASRRLLENGGWDWVVAEPISMSSPLSAPIVAWLLLTHCPPPLRCSVGLLP